MPKCKPCKGIVKRVRITRNGKVVRRGSGVGHRKVVKTKRQKRRLRRAKPLAAPAARALKRMLGLM